MIANLRVGLETVSQVVWLPNTFLGEKKMNTDDSKKGYIPWSCDACGSPCKKSLGPEGYCDTCRPIMLNGGNTPERVEEQIEWLKKLAEKENE